MKKRKFRNKSIQEIFEAALPPPTPVIQVANFLNIGPNQAKKEIDKLKSSLGLPEVEIKDLIMKGEIKVDTKCSPRSTGGAEDVGTAGTMLVPISSGKPAPPQRKRLGGERSQSKSKIPLSLQQFAEEFKGIEQKKLEKVLEKFEDPKESGKIESLAFTIGDLLGKKVGGTQVLGRVIGGKTIDMDFVADLVLGNKKAIESVFKTMVIPTKSTRLFNTIVNLIGIGETKKLFSSEDKYNEFVKTLKVNENKGYIKLANILF
jgi:hypothetical protein